MATTASQFASRLNAGFTRTRFAPRIAPGAHLAPRLRCSLASPFAHRFGYRPCCFACRLSPAPTRTRASLLVSAQFISDRKTPLRCCGSCWDNTRLAPMPPPVCRRIRCVRPCVGLRERCCDAPARNCCDPDCAPRSTSLPILVKELAAIWFSSCAAGNALVRLIFARVEDLLAGHRVYSGMIKVAAARGAPLDRSMLRLSHARP